MAHNTPNLPPKKEYITPKEAVELTKIRYSSIIYYCNKDEKLNAFKENGRWKIPLDSIEYLCSLSPQPTILKPPLDASTRWQRFTSNPWIFWPTTAFTIIAALLTVAGMIISSAADSPNAHYARQPLWELGIWSSGCTHATDDETLILLATFHRTMNDSEPHKKILRKIQEEIDKQKIENMRAELVDVELNADQRVQAEKLGRECNASIVIWGEDTGVEIVTNFLNLRQPDFDTADAKVIESGLEGKTQLANPEAYAQFITKELPAQMSFFSLFSIGQSYYIDEKYKESAFTIEQAIMVLSDITTTVGLANAYFRLGWLYQQPPLQLDRAIINYNYAIQLTPRLVSAYNNRGSAHASQDNLKSAIEDFDKAIELDPMYAVAYYNRGSARSTQNDLNEAIADYNKAIELDQKFAIAYNNRGIVRYHQDYLEAAIEDFDKAIELDPKDAFAYSNRGSVRKKLDDLKSAIEDFNKAIELAPMLETAYFNRAVARYDQGDINESIKDYDKSIELNPMFAAAYINRGNAHEKLNDYQAAIEDYDKAIELDPKNADAYNNRGLARSAQNDLSGAIEDYDKAIELDPKNADAYNNRGNARSAQNDLSGAIEDYDKAVVVTPNYAAAYIGLGNAYFVKQDFERANENYGKALKLNDHLAAAYVGLGNVLYIKQKKEEALNEYNKAIIADPDYLESYGARGLAHFELGNYKDGLEDIRQWLALAPKQHPMREESKRLLAEIEEKLTKAR